MMIENPIIPFKTFISFSEETIFNTLLFLQCQKKEKIKLYYILYITILLQKLTSRKINVVGLYPR